MLRCSVLERLCGPLCDALLGEDTGADKLAELAGTNLFLRPLDDHGQWYRFHNLFRQLLRVELEHREPGLAATLHRRAYAWHRDHGSIEEAVEHALRADAFAEAGELIAARWVEFANAGRHATVLAWLERFPPSLLECDAPLITVKAWVLSLCARQEEAAEAMAAAERLEGLDEEARPVIERGVESLRSSDQPIGLAHALIHQVHLLRGLGDDEAAAAAIAEARAIVDTCPDPGILGERLAALERPPRARPTTGNGRLSERERTVLRALTGPLSERDIARELYLSHNTVHSHTRSVYRKLGVSSRSEAVRRARELRLL